MWIKTLRLLSALFAVAVFASACGGSTATDTAATDDAAMSDEAMSDEAMDDDDHGDHEEDDDHDHGDHATVLEVNADAPVPAVAVELTETDVPGMFDLVVTLTNFTITPDNVDGDPIDNEGHMHLLIDGEKVDRFYELEREVMVPEGDHLVEVELNANNHAAYAVDGVPIRAGETVTGFGEPEATSDDHDQDHDHSNSAAAVEDGLTMADATIAVSASFADGSVSLDSDDRIEAAIGDIVMITVTSDVAEQAHLHGYDILADLVPGEPAMMLFTADTPGKFEIEFEESGTFIAELVVS